MNVTYVGVTIIRMKNHIQTEDDMKVTAEMLVKFMGALCLIVSGVLFYYLSGGVAVAEWVGIGCVVAAVALVIEAFINKKPKTKQK